MQFTRHRVASLLLAIGPALSAADAPTPLPASQQPPKRARYIDEHQGDINTLYCAFHLECSVIAPEGEKFVHAMVGDPDAWPASELPSKVYSIRPAFPKLHTTIHIETDHGNVYAFEFFEDSKRDPDVSVILRADDLKSREAIAAPPKVVPYEDLQREKQQNAVLAQELSDAIKKVDSAAAQAAQDVREKLPSQLHSYEFDRKEAAKFPWYITDIFTDDTRFYIKRSVSAQDLPTVMTWGTDYKPEMTVMQYEPDRGYWVTTRNPHAGYLTFGSQKKEKRLEFHLEAAK